VFVHHAALGRTVVYGELMATSVASVKVGEMLNKGQRIGVGGACCLLHLEIYEGVVTEAPVWHPAPNAQVVDPDGCARTSMTTKPTALVDPRPLVNCLKPPTASILEDTGVGGEVLPPPLHNAALTVSAMLTTIAGGYIALIVLVGAFILACFGVIFYCFLDNRRRATTKSGDVDLPNAAYKLEQGPPASDADDATSRPRFVTAMASGGGTVSATSRTRFVTDVPMSTMFTPTMNAFAPTVTTPDSTQMLRAPVAGRSVTIVGGAPGSAAAVATTSVACPRCGKTYAYQVDLDVHITARHG